MTQHFSGIANTATVRDHGPVARPQLASTAPAGHPRFQFVPTPAAAAGVCFFCGQGVDAPGHQLPLARGGHAPAMMVPETNWPALPTVTSPPCEPLQKASAVRGGRCGLRS